MKNKTLKESTINKSTTTEENLKEKQL